MRGNMKYARIGEPNKKKGQQNERINILPCICIAEHMCTAAHQSLGSRLAIQIPFMEYEQTRAPNTRRGIYRHRKTNYQKI